MSKEQMAAEDRMTKKRKPEEQEAAGRHAHEPGTETAGLAGLQQLVGNRTVQRLLAQRSGDGPTELDDDTAQRINRERGGGQPLDGALQEQRSAALGHDFSGVRVHTSPEADDLSHQLGAKAFTTGQDLFFQDGAYDPHSSAGQELITHELTHVAQQGTGQVRSGGRMAVNPPGDAFEQEADATAKATSSEGLGAQVQRQDEPEEEEEAVQAQAEEEEEAVQTQAEPEEEEEEAVQAQAEPEEEEEAVQAQAEEEEEEPIQAQVEPEEEEEEEAVQAQAEEEEEAVQAQDETEEEMV